MKFFMCFIVKDSKIFPPQNLKIKNPRTCLHLQIVDVTLYLKRFFFSVLSALIQTVL